MAAGTVAYTDTTGNKDYLGTIASQIGRRLKEASDMASDERAFAEVQAERGGTSLDEAGIGKGFFFKRALGSRFGGDKIARTKGRMGATGPGTSPTGNFRSRFRGGFDYNVTNEISAATAPLSNSVVAGLRGVESGLVQVGQSIDGLAVGLGNLARAQEDTARQAILNGAFMQAFLNHMQREASRNRAGKEEAGLERRLRGFGGGGSGRGMINVTPQAAGGAAGGGAGNFLRSLDTVQTGAKAATNVKGIKKLQSGSKAVKQAFRSKGVSNIFGISKAPRTVTKAMANKNIVKALPGASRKIVKAVRKTGLAGTAAQSAKSLKAAKGAEKLADTLQMANDVANADRFAKGMKNIDYEDALIKRIYGNAGDIPIPKKQAAKGFASLVDGSFDGTARNTDEALDAWKYLFGEDQYKRLMGGADAPIGKAMKGTFTHKMLKAPGIPKAMATAGKNTMAKTLLKKIPVIAGIAGIIFGIQRALEGDFVGAGLEVTSGLLGATGKGAGLSLAIDGYLLGRDMGMMPMARGGFLTKPTPVVAGEAGAEGFFPLEGSRGKKTFAMFGEGVLQAQKDNASDVAKIQADGLKRYFEGMNGFEAFGRAIKDVFTGLRDLLPDNPLESIRNFFGFGKKNPNVNSISRNNYDFGHNLPPTGTLGTGAQMYGASRPGGRQHSGQDFDIEGPDATFESQIGGKVTRILDDPGGYGKYIDIYNKDLDVTERIAEGAETLVKVGDEITPGTPVTRGETNTGVIHYEIRKGKAETYGFQGTMNPMDFLREHTGHTNGIPSNLKTNISPNQVHEVPDDAGFKLFPFSSSSNPDGAANQLNGQSGMFGMGSIMMPTTVINNNYAVANGGDSGGGDDFNDGFPQGFEAFTVPFSLASK